MNHSDIEHMAQGYPPSHTGKDCEEVITWLATQLLANQEQRDGLAAENAALISAFMPKEIPTEATDNFSDTAVLRIDGDEFHSWQWVDNQDEVIRGVLNFFKPKTPATDAYLNAVRAEGALLVAERMRKARYVFKDMHHGVVSECADIAVDVAKKLRAGETS